MQNFNNTTLIEILEEWASDQNRIAGHDYLIESEDHLSRVFDDNIAPAVAAKYGADDTVAFNEAFNDWTDTLVEEGTLHPEQLNSYCYVGEYA